MKLIKPLDILLIILIMALSVVLVFSFIGFGNDENKTAVIRLDGKVIKQIDLNHVTSSYDIDVGGSCNVCISVYNDGVEFKHSDCADKVCVNTGKITQTGSSAVCLPGKVSVEIVSGDPSADAVVW